MLPRPMLLRPGQIPSGDGWAFEIKYDGFRALVATENGLEVRSRQAWAMTERLPELAKIPRGLVLDGELVTFNEAGAHTGRCCASGCSTGTPRSR